MILDNFLIFDAEATGVNPVSSSILTGSFIYCDKALNIVDRYDFKCRPRYWDKYAYEAVAIHKISYQEALGYPDFYDTMREVVHWLETLEPSHFVAHVNRLAGMFENEDKPELKRPKAVLTAYDYELLTQSLFDIDSSHYELYRVAPIQSLISTHSLAKYLKLPCEYNLKGIARYLGLSEFSHHDAREDTTACLGILRLLLPQIDLEKFLLWENFKIKEEENGKSNSGADSKTKRANRRANRDSASIPLNSAHDREVFTFDL